MFTSLAQEEGKLHKHINVTIFNEFLKYMFTSSGSGKRKTS